MGNCLTWYNGMTQMIQGSPTATRAPRRCSWSATPRTGRRCSGFSGERRLSDLIAGVRWDDVVLQEQSELLSFTQPQYEQTTVPYARTLTARIAADGARTVLEMTWGYRQGDPQNFAGDTYSAMQARLEQGYGELGRELDAPVAPVGLAWRAALWQRPGLDLWADGRHPNRAGSYLTACVLYAELSGPRSARKPLRRRARPRRGPFLPADRPHGYVTARPVRPRALDPRPYAGGRATV